MNLQERLKNAYKALRGAELKDSAETEVTTYGDGAEKLLEWLGIDSKNTKAINEVTYYTCLKLLAETIGKMPSGRKSGGSARSRQQ